MDWSSYYPHFVEPGLGADIEVAPASESDTIEMTGTVSGQKKMRKSVEVVDIGCGFGGLLVALAPRLPSTLLLGKTERSGPLMTTKTDGYRP